MRSTDGPWPASDPDNRCHSAARRIPFFARTVQDVFFVEQSRRKTSVQMFCRVTTQRKKTCSSSSSRYRSEVPHGLPPQRARGWATPSGIPSPFECSNPWCHFMLQPDRSAHSHSPQSCALITRMLFQCMLMCADRHSKQPSLWPYAEHRGMAAALQWMRTIWAETAKRGRRGNRSLDVLHGVPRTNSWGRGSQSAHARSRGARAKPKLSSKHPHPRRRSSREWAESDGTPTDVEWVTRQAAWPRRSASLVPSRSRASFSQPLAQLWNVGAAIAGVRLRDDCHTRATTRARAKARPRGQRRPHPSPPTVQNTVSMRLLERLKARQAMRQHGWHGHTARGQSGTQSLPDVTGA